MLIYSYVEVLLQKIGDLCPKMYAFWINKIFCMLCKDENSFYSRQFSFDNHYFRYHHLNIIEEQLFPISIDQKQPKSQDFFLKCVWFAVCSSEYGFKL